LRVNPLQRIQGLYHRIGGGERGRGWDGRRKEGQGCCLWGLLREGAYEECRSCCAGDSAALDH